MRGYDGVQRRDHIRDRDERADGRNASSDILMRELSTAEPSVRFAVVRSGEHVSRIYNNSQPG